MRASFVRFRLACPGPWARRRGVFMRPGSSPPTGSAAPVSAAGGRGGGRALIIRVLVRQRLSAVLSGLGTAPFLICPISAEPATVPLVGRARLERTAALWTLVCRSGWTWISHGAFAPAAGCVPHAATVGHRRGYRSVGPGRCRGTGCRTEHRSSARLMVAASFESTPGSSNGAYPSVPVAPWAVVQTSPHSGHTAWLRCASRQSRPHPYPDQPPRQRSRVRVDQDSEHG
jgi:hypothetical protein